jgi:hypothetical protein
MLSPHSIKALNVHRLLVKYSLFFPSNPVKFLSSTTINWSHIRFSSSEANKRNNTKYTILPNTHFGRKTTLFSWNIHILSPRTLITNMDNTTLKKEVQPPTIKGQSSNWFPLNLKSIKELSLDKTLRCGQSFRWKKVNLPLSTNETKECWLGVIGTTVYGLRENGDDIYYCTFSKSNDSPDVEAATVREKLRDYLRLDISLEELYEKWCSSDKRFQDSSVQFAGIRLLRQDPVECLFSFICSQNNNIARITKMLGKIINSSFFLILPC